MIDNINIITWYARGIKQKCIELFDNLIDKNIHTSICLVIETWLKFHFYNSVLRSNFSCNETLYNNLQLVFKSN